MKRWSSLRRTAAPIPVALMVPPGNPPGEDFERRLFRHRLGPRRDRLHDVVVAGAAADVAFQLMANSVLVELVTLAVHDVDRRHDHARRAIAALQPVVLAERLLHRMQGTVRLGETLDGGDVGALDLPGEDGTRLHRLAVHMHHAGAALRGVAAHMGAGEPQVLAQELDQQRARIDVTGDGLAVHRQSDGGHDYLLGSGQTPCFWRCRPQIEWKSGQFCPDFQPVTRRVLNPAGIAGQVLVRSRGAYFGATAAANFTKKSSAVFLAALLIRRWPSWASLPP